MNTRQGTIAGLLLLLFIVSVLIPACISPSGVPGSTGTADTVPVPETTVEPVVSPEASESQAPLVPPDTGEPGILPAPEKNTTALPTPSPVSPSPEPLVSSLTYSRLFSEDISNCVMTAAFPDITRNPGYGLISVRSLNLQAVPASEVRQFERDYLQPGTSSVYTISKCYGLPDTPYWNFLEVKGFLIARNARPATYDVILVIRYEGVDGPEIHLQQTFLPDQEIPYYTYIPIKVNEIRYISGVQLKFNQTG